MAFEGALNKIIGFGLAVDRPITPALAPGQLGIYVSTDTGAADYWYAGAWHNSLDGAATAAQGALANTAVQPGNLAPVATSGSYNDLIDTPTAPTPYTDEMAQDAFAAMIAAGTHSGITATYDDAGNAIGFTVTATGSVRNRGTATYSGANIIIDMQGGLVRDFAAAAPTANITGVTITNPPAAGLEFNFSIRIANVGAYTFTKPGNWSPIGQSDTTFTASKAHIIEAKSYDDGTTILFAMQEIP